MTSYIQSAFTKLFGTSEFRLLILGLDAAGKTTVLYRLKLGEVVTTIPTIGFNVETVMYKKASLTFWDIGGRDRMRALMRHYFQNTQGLVYVVDGNDRERLPEALDGLQILFLEDELRDAPLLIYLNKIDLPNAMRPEELTEKMRLHSIRNRSWHVQPCSATNGDGLYEGLDWMMRAIKSPNVVMKPTFEPPPTAAGDTYRETNKSLQWLSQEDDDSPEEFLDKFRQHQLLREQFDHRSLLRVLWSSLHSDTRKATIKIVFDHLPFYIDAVNETLTYFWIQIVHYAREATKNPTNDFAGFLLLNPQVLNEAELPLVYYKKKTLFSPAAKAAVMLPDVKALPSILPASSTASSSSSATPLSEELDDETFLSQFESCSLSNWSHRSHVRMAWLYLRRDGRREGMKKIFDGIKHFIANSSPGHKPADHFTLTYFWIQMIDLAIAQSPKEIDFDEFLRQNPHLLKENLYLDYYTKETMLNNAAAREQMVLPDIKPLPNLVPTAGKK